MDTHRSWYAVREYLFPQGCGICGNMLISPEEAWYGLCRTCKADLAIETSPRCDLCGRPLISEINRCLPCRQNAETENPSCDGIAAIFPYTGKYRELLGAFKFGKSIGAGHFLADCLSEALKLLCPDEMQNPVLVPVPPRPGKIRKTGWDQIYILAKLLKQKQNAPRIVSCLRRQTSQTQKKLDRKDRKTNLKGRIQANAKAPPECILFDDVITTGSTMNACAAALELAGARKVFGLCLFYD